MKYSAVPLLLCLAANLTAFQAAISGVVRDAQAAIPAVTINISTPGVPARQIMTDATGRYAISGLKPGAYRLTFTRAGFEAVSRTLTLTGSSQTLDVTMPVSTVATTLEVVDTAGASALQLDSTASGGTLLNIPVRELPASISIISQQMMQERGVRSSVEAVEQSVGMIAGTSVGSIPTFTARGFSGNNVTLMRDGIRQNTASQSARPLDSFLMERMEVLKGPSSILYGEGAIGAAINIVSKEAHPRFAVDGILSYGSFNTLRSGVGINGPVTRNLFVRADASYYRTDGYMKNSGQDLGGVNTALRYNVSENISLSLNGSWAQDFTSSYYGTPLINGLIDPRTRFLNYNMQDNLAKSRNRFGRATFEWRLPANWQLRNYTFLSTHTLDWRNFESYAYNPTSRLVDVSSFFLIWRNDFLSGNRTDVQGSFRLFGRTVRSVSGVQYQNNDLRRGGGSDATIRRSVDPFNPSPILDPGRAYVRDRDVLIRTFSLFSEAVIDITSKLKAIGGIRYERIGLDYTLKSTGAVARQSYRPPTGRAGILYNFNSTFNAYASYTKAVEPVAQLVSLSGVNQAFSLVPGRQVEIGSKATFLQSRLDFTAAWFDIEKRDILTTSIVDGRNFAQQIGKQKAKGIELTSLFRPTRSLTVSADLAFTRAQYADFIEIVAGGNVSRSGNLPPNVARRVMSFWANQRFGAFNLSGTVRHVGKRFADNANLAAMGGYTIFDAALSFRMPKGGSLALRGRNLTDAVYAAWSSSGGTAWRLEAPRSYDITWTTRF